ncbi:Hint domain-containing protein [Methylobacterium sp. JK268]
MSIPTSNPRLVVEGDSLTASGIWVPFALQAAAPRNSFDLPDGYNQAVGGETATQMAGEVGSVNALHPDAVVLLAGTNDIPQRKSAAQIYGTLTRMWKSYLDAGAQYVVAVDVPPRIDPTWQNSTANEPTRAELNRLINTSSGDPSLVAYGSRIRVVGDVGLDPSTDTLDGIHENPAGAAKIGAAIGGVLGQLQFASTAPAPPAATVNCFAAGTRLLTPQGARRIEDLAPGDLLVTADGAARPVTWVGRRRLRLGAHPQPERVRPVRIRAGAVAPGIPERDLVLSPGHGVRFADHLVPAGALVDGEAVAVLDWSEVEYLHVELDLHDVVLAEGLPCESYLEAGQRAGFDGEDGATILHPVFTPLTYEASCLPVAIAGPAVEAAKALIAARTAASRGETDPAGAARRVA